MSNFSIVVSKNTKELFLTIWKKFEDNFSLFKNVVIANTDDNIKLIYSIKEKNNDSIKNLVKGWIADSVVLYYKTNYLENNLKLPSKLSVPFKALCKALAVFDKQADVKLALSELELTKEVNINSFYSFKLAELRLRWQEICDLFYQNLPELIASNAFIDLMRYLLSISETIAPAVYLELKSDFIYLKDDKNNNIIKPIPNTAVGEEKLILELITLSPESIVIMGKDKGKDIDREIKYLFNDKVIYCT